MELIGTFWALVPPIVAIALALITKETYSSLFIGTIVGAVLLAIHFGDPASIMSWVVHGRIDSGIEDQPLEIGLIPSLADSAGIFIFLVLLGVMVALINSAGSSAAFGQWAAKHVKTRIGSKLATFFLGVLLFVDDYFNCLTIGAVMRTVTDEHRISRAKLSYIIDATAAPICMIAPVSSWAAAVSNTANSLDSGISGIQLFIAAIPYNFYSLLTIFFVVLISIMGFDYGPMAKAEIKAWKENELGSLGKEEHPYNKRANLLDMFLPVIVLIVCCVIGMMYIGGFWDPESANHGDIISAFADTEAGEALSWGSLIAVMFTFLYFLLRKLIVFPEAADSFIQGFKAMTPAMLILVFALTLKSITGALGAAEFVGGLMEDAGGLYAFLPAIIFLVGLGLAFATGTSWGTFGILIPIVVTVFANDPNLLIIGISACLAGAVCGDHISPISDTTIMSSAGANIYHLEHVSTQIPYALTVAGISFISFLVAGFVQNWIMPLCIGLVLTALTLIVLKKTIGVDVTKLEQNA